MPKPNFIFILIDDMGWADLSCYGSTFHETPNLDRLAADGLRFTDAYATCPVCSPTRASLMTGKYPATVGMTNYLSGSGNGKVLSAPYIHHLPLTEKTVARALGEGGYTTWHVGKWHLGQEAYWPQHQGFDVNIGGWDAGMPTPSYFSPYNNPTLPDGPDGEYLTDRLTDEAIQLIRSNDDGPFFLNLCYYTVHIPIEGKPEYVEKYKAKAAKLGLDQQDPFEVGEHFPCEHKKTERVVRRTFQSDPGYAAMIQSLDENLGRLFATLDEQGIADDTVIFFTSDNGGLATAESSPTSNAPLAEGKGWMYEGGTREPLIVKWPSVTQPGSLCDVPVTTTDFYPTMLDMAGLPLIPEQHCDGVSIVPLLKGEAELDREAIFWHYPHYGNQGGTPGCSVRAGDYKLIEFFEDTHVELYNLRDDIAEEHDLATKDPQTAQRLCDMLHAWLEQVNAKLPQPNPDYAP